MNHESISTKIFIELKPRNFSTTNLSPLTVYCIYEVTEKPYNRDDEFLPWRKLKGCQWSWNLIHPLRNLTRKSNSCNYLDIFESEILQSLTSYMEYVWYDVSKDQVCYSTSQVLKKIKIVARISTWMAVIMIKFDKNMMKLLLIYTYQVLCSVMKSNLSC